MGFWWCSLGLMGFVCRDHCGSWVCGFCSLLYLRLPSLPLTVRLLSLKFSLVFVVIIVVVVVFFLFFFFFFFFGYGVDFWMDADCGGSGLVMGLGLLLNVNG